MSVVDEKEGIVYIPTGHGIYTYSTTTNKTGDLLPNTGNNIYYLQLKDNKLYYTVHITNNYKLFEYDLVNREPAKIVEAFQDIYMDVFVIDDDGDITFTNNSKNNLYTWKKQINRFERYNNSTIKNFYCLFYDRYNSIIYSHVDDGIYTVDKNAMTLKKVFDADRGVGLAIDKYNNTIYSDYKYIYRVSRK